MFGLENIGSQTVRDAGVLAQLVLTELFAGIHSVLDRVNGTELRMVDGGTRLVIPQWTPRP